MPLKVPMRAVQPLSAVILLSGGGTTFQNLLEQMRNGSLAIDIRGVLSSRPDAFGLVRARGANVPTNVVPRREFMDARSFSREVFKRINAVKPDLLVLAGFMCLLHLPDRYIGRTVNIHPGLLPKFGGKGMYGIHVHEAVIKAREKVSGCTVHYVDNEYDHGPIILQKTVPVEPNDTPQTLMDRVMLVEREAYPEAINMIADGRVRYENGQTVFA
ncbi:MAG: phosphoribosylglycinamide formyltransferase [Planctomycetes bacterium]|nr:phosphoribosylglycinamide formyltransferase [Planctomycetota bacterium]